MQYLYVTGERGELVGVLPVRDLVFARREAAAREVPPGSLGLMLVPYWNGVMNPYWDPAASGIIVGWRGTHTRAHLYRAILEGIAFEQHLNTLGVEAALGRPLTRYIALGGGAFAAHVLALAAAPIIHRLFGPDAFGAAQIVAAIAVDIRGVHTLRTTAAGIVQFAGEAAITVVGKG